MSTRVRDLVYDGCAIVRGDISALASMQGALEGVDAVYVCVHTLSPQPGDASGRTFMDVESEGLRNIVTACRTQGVRRLVYVTFLGSLPIRRALGFAVAGKRSNSY